MVCDSEHEMLLSSVNLHCNKFAHFIKLKFHGTDTDTDNDTDFLADLSLIHI